MAPVSSWGCITGNTEVSWNRTPEKSGFYEQVIHVKGFSVFLSWRFSLSFCSVVVGPHIVLHRVSIRTLVSRSRLCVGWGQKEKSMLPVFGRPRSGPNPTRSHRDAG